VAAPPTGALVPEPKTTPPEPPELGTPVEAGDPPVDAVESSWYWPQASPTKPVNIRDIAMVVFFKGILRLEKQQAACRCPFSTTPRFLR
jgi:hypothetical protein